MIIEKVLPFARGTFYSEARKGTGALVTMDDSTAKNLEGRLYQVQDTLHKRGGPVILRIVKNDAGRDITCSRRCVSFSTTSTEDWGHRVNNFGAAGVVAKPIDDAYYYGENPTYTSKLELTMSSRNVETTIMDDDLFYVVEEGPCDVESTTVAGTTAVGGPVQCIAGGVYGGQIGPAVDDDYQVGTYLETVSTASITAILIEVHAGISPRGIMQ